MKQRPSMEGNATSEGAFYSTTLIELLRWRALHQPHTVGYTFLADGERQAVTLTYDELDRQARAVANLLAGLTAPGERALLVYPPGLEFVAGFFGCLYAGVVAVPVYPPDPSRLNRTLPRLQAIAADAGAKVVLTTPPILAMAQPMSRQIPALEEWQWVAHDEAASGSADDWQEPRVSPDALAFLQYTSGSTGDPKGVMLTHGNLLHNAMLVYHALEHSPDDKYLSWLPTFHDMGFMAGVLQPLYAGIPVVSLPPAAFLQQPARWLQAICDHKATISGAPNFAYDLCARKVSAEQRAALDLSSWRVAFNGAEPVRPESLGRFVRAFAPCGFLREAFYPCYGLAEATLMVSGGLRAAPPTVKTLQARSLERNQVVEARGPDDDAQSIVGCGRTMRGQEILIVDPESLIECPPDRVGEIWVSGPSVAQGYWKRPQETERAFRAALAGGGRGGFLRTGDLGFLQDGELYVTGRLKDLIVIRGVNHYPQDIELTVENSHPSLRPGCGAAFSIEAAGEERLVVVQEAEESPGFDPDEAVDSIRRAVAEQHDLQLYAAVLIKARSIPKTSSGKIRRQACRLGYLKGELDEIARGLLEPAGSADMAIKEESFIRKALLALKPAERPAVLEVYLKERVAAALNIAPSMLRPHRPLISLGIDSLMAVELKNRVESDLGAALPAAIFLQGDSLSQLAEQISNLLDAPPAPGSPPARPADNEYPLSYMQQALWLLYQFAPAGAAYNVSFAARITSEVNIDALRRSFQALSDRHTSLRSSFTTRDGQPVQRITPGQSVDFQASDASTLSLAEFDEELAGQSLQPFDLERGPVFRVRLFKRQAEEYVILITAHHIAMDGWSLWILLDELGVLYTAYDAGESPSLPALAGDYGGYVAWQSDMLKGPEGERLWQYWRQELEGELPVLDLPISKPRPPAQTYAGASHGFGLAERLTARLKALAKSENATLYMTLLAAFQVLLHRYTGLNEILIGSPVSGRSRADFEAVIGCFFNTVVLRADLSGDSSFSDFLKQVRRKVLRAIEHQDYPSHLLAERSQTKRDRSRPPLFQVTFILQKPHRSRPLAALPGGGVGPAVFDLGALKLKHYPLPERQSRVDLELEIIEADGSLSGWLHYNSDLFDGAAIARLADHFAVLLEGVVAAAHERIASLPLLPAAEFEQLTKIRGAAEADQPGDICIHHMLERQAGQTPSKVVAVQGDRFLSFQELNDRAGRLAGLIRRIEDDSE
jgi:acyl-CoA synthetase (AMP-forming)/AMP-acid ligase II/acyl carrier protein